MLSIGKLGSTRGEYYLAVVAAGVEDYDLREGEAPGRWLSHGGLDLPGEDTMAPKVHGDGSRGTHRLRRLELHTGRRRRRPDLDTGGRVPGAGSLEIAVRFVQTS